MGTRNREGKKLCPKAEVGRGRGIENPPHTRSIVIPSYAWHALSYSSLFFYLFLELFLTRQLKSCLN